MPTGQQILEAQDRHPGIPSSGTTAGVAVVGGTTTGIANYLVGANRRAVVSVDVQAQVTTALAAGQGGAVHVKVGVVPNQTISQRYIPVASPVGTQQFLHFDGLIVGAGETVTAEVVCDPGAGALGAFGLIHGVEYDA